MTSNPAIRFTAVLLFVTTAVAAAAATRPETLLVVEPSAAFPRNSEGDIIPLSNGRLGLIYSRFRGGASDHAEADLAMRISPDSGRTWSTDRVIVAQQGGRNVMSASLLRLQSGAIALFYLRKTSLEDCRPLLRLSHDEAETWSEPVECITDEIGYYVMNNDRAVQLAGGRIVLPVALHRRQGDAEPDWAGEVMCYLSDDQGRSWRRGKDVRKGFDPNGDRVTIQEPGVVELADGRLMMFCRTDAGSQYVAWSRDQGDTWSPLQPSGLVSPLSPATIERLPATGDLLCVYNDHSGVHEFPAGRRTPLCLAISRDDGATWSRSELLEDDPDGWYCYTSMTFAAGRVVLSYCAGDSQVGGLNRLKVIALNEEELMASAENRRIQTPDERSTALLESSLDYGRSFINTRAVWNSPRFWVESRCRITDAAARKSVEYFQCGSCKSENTFAERDLFHEDNYDFLPIFAAEHTIVFRHTLVADNDPRDVRPTDKWWEGIEPKLRHVQARVLDSPEAIFAAMQAGEPIVGQSEIRDPQSGRVAVLEFPVKTINWHREQKLWQVDTGPVLLPDLTQPAEQWPHTIQLAYIAFNRTRGADFVVIQPMAVREEGEVESTNVFHYARPVHRQTRNVLLAIEK